MRKGNRVLLKTFNGTSAAPRDVEKREDYWVLIEETGTIVDDNRTGGFSSQDGHPRMLIRFDANLDDLELENHNHIANSLWIRSSDFEVLD